MHTGYIFPLRSRKTPTTIGGKAEKLRVLIRHGFRVPATYVCTWDAHARYRAGAPELTGRLREELGSKLDPDRVYAVRSSANLEDGSESSFAGQFRSVLGVQGIDKIVTAMQEIWAATDGPGVTSYLERNAIEPGGVKMAIIIQEMVQPFMSGVSFSKNPLTGMDEVIVEAVHGSGEALVQEGTTPMRWINKWGTWITKPERPDPELAIIEEVRQQTKAIARVHGRPVDLEWVHDGRTLNWVQLREITALEAPVYSNRISSEVFPGIIKPLIWSINVPLVNGAWVRLLTELVGSLDVEPESLAAMFYYRAYFDMGSIGQIFEALGLPRETIELLLGIEVEGPEKPSFSPTRRTYALLPRMLAFVASKLRFAKELDRHLPRLEEQFRGQSQVDLSRLNEGEILERIDSLFATAQEMAYYNIVAQLLMLFYGRLLKMQLGRAGIDIEVLDVTAGMEELHQYEPDLHLARLQRWYRELAPSVQAQISKCDYKRFRQMAGIEPFQEAVNEFIERFGHLSDSGNDFTTVPWRENPDLILKMIVDHEPTRGRVTEKTRYEGLNLPALQRLQTGPVYRRARRYRYFREAASSQYAFGYGLFRDLYLALGDRLARRKAIESREDIFFLYSHEVREMVEGDGSLSQARAIIGDRKRELVQARDVRPPSILYGDQEPPIQPASGPGLSGVATSRGRYTGPVKVLQRTADFDRLQNGDVLVIPYSDVGWTPLFTRAGAVVAESGGILSHSSIVAREYGIPAVVSVPGACQLVDGTMVTVDGYRGEISVHEPGQG